MGATLGSMPLPFAHIEPGSVPTAIKDLEFPGVDGVGGLDMGKRKRRITVTGFLVDAITGSPTGKAIEELDTGAVFELDAGIGDRKFKNCRVVEARTHNWAKTSGEGGVKQSCEYTIELEQLRS